MDYVHKCKKGVSHTFAPQLRQSGKGSICFLTLFGGRSAVSLHVLSQIPVNFKMLNYALILTYSCILFQKIGFF